MYKRQGKNACHCGIQITHKQREGRRKHQDALILPRHDLRGSHIAAVPAPKLQHGQIIGTAYRILLLCQTVHPNIIPALRSPFPGKVKGSGLRGNDGPAAFKALLDKCGNDVEYRLQKLKNAHNIQLTEGKVAFLEEAAKLIATISSPIERDVYSSKVASELGVDKNAFKQQVSRVSRRGERAEEKKQARQIQLELSRRNDKINPEHFQKPRSSSAEEALLVYLLNNPDAYEEISARVKPEQFQNTLMRRFFEYFSARIERGEDPLTNTAADFTQDENSKLYQLMSQAIPGASTAEAMNEYINVINEESSKLNSGDLADVSNEELMAYLDKIRKKKQ